MVVADEAFYGKFALIVPHCAVPGWCTTCQHVYEEAAVAVFKSRLEAMVKLNHLLVEEQFPLAIKLGHHGPKECDLLTVSIVSGSWIHTGKCGAG